MNKLLNILKNITKILPEKAIYHMYTSPSGNKTYLHFLFCQHHTVIGEFFSACFREFC